MYTYASPSLSTGAADGLRIAQDADGTITSFAWDWATGVPELLSDGDKRYLVGHDTLGWEDAGGWTYAVPDALGSVRQAVDATAAVVAAREWTPYGVEVGGTQAGLGYTGEWFDAGVGLQYLRARWYDAQTGRFVSRDPWYGHLKRPNTQNGFSYVVNNPSRFVDPLGLCEIDPYDPYLDYDCWLIAYDISTVYGGLSVFGELSHDDLRDYYQNVFIFSNPNRPTLHRLSETPSQIVTFWKRQPGHMDCGPTSLAMALSILQYRYYGIDTRSVPSDQVINLADVIPLSSYNSETGVGPLTVSKVAKFLGWEIKWSALNQNQDLIKAIDRDEVTLVSYGDLAYSETQTCYWYPGGGQCVTSMAVPIEIRWAHMMLLYAYSETTRAFGFLDPLREYNQQIHWIPEREFLNKWDDLFSQMWSLE